jgi:hypothetical protein
VRIHHLMFVLVWLVAVALPSAATATQAYTPHHGHHCRKGYRRVVLHRQHRRSVVCIKRHGKPKTAQQAARVKLHAHLDPTYTRDPLNPFKVTYDFSASATQESAPTQQTARAQISDVETPAPLPFGVLALYSDGKLECAINVGGGITGSACPVTYSALGAHSVTTIYTSGEQSATATEVEQIEPIASHTSVSWSFSPVIYEGEQIVHEKWAVGTLTINTSVSPTGKPNVALCESVCSTSIGTALAYNVMQTDLTVWGKSPNKCGPEEPLSQLGIESEFGGIGYQPVGNFDGEHDYLSATFAGIGYVPSESTPSLLTLTGYERPFVNPASAPAGDCN